MASRAVSTYGLPTICLLRPSRSRGHLTPSLGSRASETEPLAIRVEPAQEAFRPGRRLSPLVHVPSVPKLEERAHGPGSRAVSF